MSTLITATKELHWSSGHRVYGHETTCKNLHGHNYRGEFHVRNKYVSLRTNKDQLDNLGMVLDFHAIKDNIWPWIEQNWDHAFIYWTMDREVKHLRHQEVVNTLKWYEGDFNPTAENMAYFLLKLGNELISHTNAELWKVTVHETHTCFAEASL